MSLISSLLMRISVIRSLIEAVDRLSAQAESDRHESAARFDTLSAKIDELEGELRASRSDLSETGATISEFAEILLEADQRVSTVELRAMDQLALNERINTLYESAALRMAGLETRRDEGEAPDFIIDLSRPPPAPA